MESRAGIAEAEKMRRVYNRLAFTWEMNVDEKARSRSREMVFSLGLEPGSRVLDVGTGTGLLLRWLREIVGAEGEVYALDLAENMLFMAGLLRGWEGLRLFQGDAAHMPFQSESFDAVICHNSFHLFPRRDAVLREMRRVLVFQGSLVISSAWSREELNRQLREFPVALHGSRGLPEKREMSSELRAAGFADITVSEGPDRYLLRARRS